MATPSSKKLNVAILGHSHARRMQENMEQRNKWFDIQGMVVAFFVLGGLTVDKFLTLDYKHGLLTKLTHFRPDVVCLMLGDNDLGRMSVGDVMKELERLMEILRERLGVSRFVCFSVLPRDGHLTYNTKARELHESMLGWVGRKDVLYFPHKNSRFSLYKPTSPCHFLPDSVHLSDGGYRLLFDSVQYRLKCLLKIWNLQ